MPDTAEITVAKSADKRFVCETCEEICYTLTVSNTGNSTINGVMVYDDIPLGLCYKENSTRLNNGASTDKNPASGIYIGELMPGEMCFISFILVVCIPICCICSPTEFVNTARAAGYYCGKKVIGKSEPWVVKMNGRCLCRCVRGCLPVCDSINVKDCYIYNRGETYHELGDWRFVNAQYGICVEYADKNGAIRKKTFESKVIFVGLPEDFNTDQFTVRFTQLSCCVDSCGNFIAEFAAHLHYCNKTILKNYNGL